MAYPNQKKVYTNSKGTFMICPTCETHFKTKPSHVYRRVFCSKTCKRLSDKHKETIKLIMSKNSITKTCLICNKEFKIPPSFEKIGRGIYCSRQCYLLSDKKQPQGEDSPSWKGENISYRALHRWVERKRGKPMECEKCGTNADRDYDWANKSHEYKRDLNDWIRLCPPCHRKYDDQYRRISI